MAGAIRGSTIGEPTGTDAGVLCDAPADGTEIRAGPRIRGRPALSALDGRTSGGVVSVRDVRSSRDCPRRFRPCGPARHGPRPRPARASSLPCPAEGRGRRHAVPGRRARRPPRREQAVLVNAWETHAYLHDPARDKAMILALYIEPAWLGSFRDNWAASGGPGFFEQPVGLITAGSGNSPGPRGRDGLRAGFAPHPRDLLPGLMIALIERASPRGARPGPPCGGRAATGTGACSGPSPGSGPSRDRERHRRARARGRALAGPTSTACSSRRRRLAQRLQERRPGRARGPDHRRHRPGPDGALARPRLLHARAFLALLPRPCRRPAERLPRHRAPGRPAAGLSAAARPAAALFETSG